MVRNRARETGVRAEMEIRQSLGFEAAHYLPVEGLAAGEDRSHGRVHGHSFELEVCLGGEAGADGRIVDVGQLREALADVVGLLDHRLLNDVEGLGVPTLENLCRWTADRMGAIFAGRLRRVRVSRPSLGESCVLRFRCSEG